MLVISTSDKYETIPGWEVWNDIYSFMGYLSLKSNTAMDLKFQIVKSGTEEPFVLPLFYFTFFDLDTAMPCAPCGKEHEDCEAAITDPFGSAAHDEKKMRCSADYVACQKAQKAAGTGCGPGTQTGGAEKVIAGGYEGYIISGNSEIEVTKEADGRTGFGSTVFGTGGDNPLDPLKMNEIQQDRTLTLKFKDTSEFEVTYEVADLGGSPGREFLFAGKSRLITVGCDDPFQKKDPTQNTPRPNLPDGTPRDGTPAQKCAAARAAAADDAAAEAACPADMLKLLAEGLP